MPGSVEYKAMLAEARKINSNLRADDPRFAHSVQMVTDDGCSFLYDSTFVVRCEDWYLIFPEHHDVKVIPESDVLMIRQFDNQIAIEKLVPSP